MVSRRAVGIDTDMITFRINDVYDKSVFYNARYTDEQVTNLFIKELSNGRHKDVSAFVLP